MYIANSYSGDWAETFLVAHFLNSNVGILLNGLKIAPQCEYDFKKAVNNYLVSSIIASID